MIAYQPVDPACDILATRLPLTGIVGLFLCRRPRPSFGPAALIDLIDEHRLVLCQCGLHFDAQVLTAEKITAESAELVRSGSCPRCGRPHDSHLQFQRNGLILSREEGKWFVWLSEVIPNRYGNAMEEHLYWHLQDWSKRNSELAEKLNVPEELIKSWRRRVGKSHTAAPKKRQPRRSHAPKLSGRHGSGQNA